MIGLALAFLAGVSALQFLPELPPMLLVAAVAVPLVAVIRHRLVLFAVLGLAWSLWAASQRVADRLPVELEGKDVAIECVVSDLPQTFERGVRFNCALESAAPDVGGGKLPQTVRLSWYHNPVPVRAGQRWHIRVRLKRPNGLMNPGAFDYERWLYVHGIGATGYVRPSADNRIVAEKVGSWVALWRQAFAGRLNDAVAGRPMAGVIKALAIGDRSDVTPQQWHLFQRTGTAHLMAISGLHIGLVAGLCFVLMRCVWSFTAVKRWSPVAAGALAALFSALLYAALAGLSIPTQRAMIMVAIVMGAVVLQRPIRPFHGLAVAMLLVVLIDPFAVLSAGFWLSFTAVALIAFIAAGRAGAYGYWQAAGRIQWAMALGLMPIVLFFFQQTSLISPIANFFAVPLIGLVVVPACLTGLVLLLVLPEVGRGLLAIADAILQWISQLLTYLSDLPFAQWDHSLVPLWSLPFACAGVLLLLSPRGMPGRWLGVVLMAPLIFAPVPRPGHGDIRLTLLDVGQGLAAVVQTARHTLLFDTGARYSDRFDMGNAAIAPFLRAQGVASIDLMVVSHGDNDHIGGAEVLYRSFDVDRVLTSEPGLMAYAGASDCRDGQAWVWDGVRFRMLAPTQPKLPGENDNSCVLQVAGKGGAVLLTGDIEAPAEQRLLQRYGTALASDVLIVPHHGSGSSSTGAFLATVRPRYALIPAGYRNRYGFPAQAVVERINRLGSELFSTAECGAVQIDLDAQLGVLEPVAYRPRHRSFYHRRGCGAGSKV